MRVSTWAAFAGSEDPAAVDGDVAMLESELQPTRKGAALAATDVAK